MISPGLYRTTEAYPLNPETFPRGILVYVGERDGQTFVVVPHNNRHTRWFWQEPVTPLTDAIWAGTLMRLPQEGYYSLPESLTFEGGGRWLENAIVQLGYNRAGEGIVFVAEMHEKADVNALLFSDRGQKISDDILNRLRWAPVLPVRGEDPQALH